MDTLTELTATPLSPALGAELTGIDLRDEMSGETVAQILELASSFGAVFGLEPDRNASKGE